MDQDTIEKRAFEAWQTVQSLQFDLLMAYKYGAEDNLKRAAVKLARAIDELNGVTVDAPAPETLNDV